VTSLLTDTERPISAAALDALRARLPGAVLARQDGGFGDRTRVWNPAAAVPPLLLVRCARAADVAVALRFARDHGLPVAVRSGGRHPAGHGTGPGLVLDLRPMARVHVDPLGRVALVGGGATWATVDAAVAPVGGTVPGVAVGGIGVAGATLAGGIGPLARIYGLASDNHLGADLVLADGTRTSTSGDQRPELRRGLRGGGGNFGVVTSLRFRLRPVPAQVSAGTTLFPAALGEAVLRCLRDAAGSLPIEANTRLSLYSVAHPAVSSRFPGFAAAAPRVGLTVVGVGAEPALAPLLRAVPSLASDYGPCSYPHALAKLDDGYPAGDGAAAGSWYVPGLPDALIAALTDAHSEMARTIAELHVTHLGGGIARVGRMSTAVPHRGAPFLVTALVRWRGAPAEEAGRAWLAQTDQRLRAHACGGPHPGYAPAGTSSADAYGADRQLRLAALKRRYDPDNVFATNLNVAPLA
jgi:FAD/FMN-containing dehydrogenase